MISSNAAAVLMGCAALVIFTGAEIRARKIREKGREELLREFTDRAEPDHCVEVTDDERI